MSPDGHSIWVSGHGALQVFLYKHINLQSKALHFLHNQSLGQFFYVQQYCPCMETNTYI